MLFTKSLEGNLYKIGLRRILVEADNKNKSVKCKEWGDCNAKITTRSKKELNNMLLICNNN